MKSNKIGTVFLLRVLLIAFLIFSNFLIKAQTLTKSPYSRYGIGDINPISLPQSFAIGGSGYGLSSNNFINLNNPASYTSFGSTIFETGVNSVGMQMENQSQKTKVNSTSLGYIAFGIPLKKWWAMSFALVPYSKVGYNITDTSSIENVGKVTYKFNGEGGVNKVMWGTAFKYKEFSIGGNASYLFGTIDKQRRLVYEDVAYAFYTKTIDNSRISDFVFDFGSQYKLKLKNDWSLNLGAVYSLSSSLKSKKEFSYVTYFPTNTNEIIRDTIQSYSLTGSTYLPASYGGGIVLDKNSKLLFNMDYSASNWTKYNAFGKTDSLKNFSQYALGVQLTPDKTSMKYWKNIHYRTGLRYANSYLNIQGIQLNEMAISFGAGIPIRRTFQEVNTDEGRIFKYLALLNLGFEIGQRGTLDNNLIKEKFISARIGITINDKWFIKRKYD